MESKYAALVAELVKLDDEYQEDDSQMYPNYIWDITDKARELLGMARRYGERQIR